MGQYADTAQQPKLRPVSPEKATTLAASRARRKARLHARHEEQRQKKAAQKALARAEMAARGIADTPTAPALTLRERLAARQAAQM